MFSRSIVTTLTAITVVFACGTIAANERAEWPRRIYQAARTLTGVWDVEGKLGEETWSGRWSCRLIPGNGIFYITCSGAFADHPQAVQHMTVLSGYDIVNRRPIERFIFSGGSGLPARRDVPPMTPEREEIPLPSPLGKVNSDLPPTVHLERKGPSELVWQSSTADGNPIQLIFRKVETDRGR